MSNEDAIKAIDNVLKSEYYFDETLGYQLTSDDIDWLEKAKEALSYNVEEKVRQLEWKKQILTFEDSNPFDEGYNKGIYDAIQIVRGE